MQSNTARASAAVPPTRYSRPGCTVGCSATHRSISRASNWGSPVPATRRATAYPCPTQRDNSVTRSDAAPVGDRHTTTGSPSRPVTAGRSHSHATPAPSGRPTSVTGRSPKTSANSSAMRRRNDDPASKGDGPAGSTGGPPCGNRTIPASRSGGAVDSAPSRSQVSRRGLCGRAIWGKTTPSQGTTGSGAYSVRGKAPVGGGR
jgi:hypothetical protein